jgi:hypothetical protein
MQFWNWGAEPNSKKRMINCIQTTPFFEVCLGDKVVLNVSAVPKVSLAKKMTKNKSYKSNTETAACWRPGRWAAPKS